MTETVIAWSGFLGAWLLVAGPLYQGALELLEQDQRAAAETSSRLPAPPPPPSAWWWLLPPGMLILRRRRSKRYRSEVLAKLTPHERARRAGFLHKAAGWFVVALGGTFIAVKETGELIRAPRMARNVAARRRRGHAHRCQQQHHLLHQAAPSRLASHCSVCDCQPVEQGTRRWCCVS